MLLARKITRAKWQPKNGISDGKIPADAITADLRTQSNALSLWECGAATQEDIEAVVLALAVAVDRIDKIDIVWFSDDDLRAGGLRIIQTPGRTPISEMSSRHYDAQNLDYEQLGTIADCVANALSNAQYKRFTQRRVRDIISAAAQQDRVSLIDLNDKIRRDIERILSE